MRALVAGGLCSDLWLSLKKTIGRRSLQTAIFFFDPASHFLREDVVSKILSGAYQIYRKGFFSASSCVILGMKIVLLYQYILSSDNSIFYGVTQLIFNQVSKRKTPRYSSEYRGVFCLSSAELV